MSNNIDVFNNNKNYITHTISYCLGRGSWKCIFIDFSKLKILEFIKIGFLCDITDIFVLKYTHKITIFSAMLFTSKLYKNGGHQI